MNITLKEIPAELHERLREVARQTGRSLNRQIIHTLEQVILPQRIDREQLAQRIRRRRDSIGGHLDADELSSAITSGRE